MHLKLFNFKSELMEYITERKTIPLDFYNSRGQVLIYQKENATHEEIERLFGFIKQGIYYNEEEYRNIIPEDKPKEKKIKTPYTNSKLISDEIAHLLCEETSELFLRLKESALTSYHVRKTGSKLADAMREFTQNQNAIRGSINILEVLQNKSLDYEIEIAVKRAVIAMALKIRGMYYQNIRDQGVMHELVYNIMMSALLCDIGFLRMAHPKTRELTKMKMDYIRYHPIMSYLMVAHIDDLNPAIKRNILCHHRPLREDKPNNNYPKMDYLVEKLNAHSKQFEWTSKQAISIDIQGQLKLLKEDTSYYDEDANILAIASEFSSLTTKVPWRNAFDPIRAVRMIINNSLFTYMPRIVRDFLDHTAISLCENKTILSEGDFIILQVVNNDAKSLYEACRITEHENFQSKPVVERCGNIDIIVEKSPKLRISGFDLDPLRTILRPAQYDLNKDLSRNIIYAVDKQYDPELHEILSHKMETL